MGGAKILLQQTTRKISTVLRKNVFSPASTQQLPSAQTSTSLHKNSLKPHLCFKTPSKSSPGAPNHDQCCAQAPLTRQRSTPNPLLGVGFAYIGPALNLQKPLLCCFSVWGQIYRTSHPETPSKIPQSKAVTHSSRRLV